MNKFDNNYDSSAKKLVKKYIDKYFKMQNLNVEKDFIAPQKAEETILDLIFKSQKEGSTKTFIENFISYLKNEIGIKEVSNAIKSPYSN